MAALVARIREALDAPGLNPDSAPTLVVALRRAALPPLFDALRQAGVGRAVYHSVASPYAPAMPHHLGKAASEDVVRRSGLGWTILQPGAYLQNLDLSALRAASSGNGKANPIETKIRDAMDKQDDKTGVEKSGAEARPRRKPRAPEPAPPEQQPAPPQPER